MRYLIIGAIVYSFLFIACGCESPPRGKAPKRIPNYTRLTVSKAMNIQQTDEYLRTHSSLSKERAGCELTETPRKNNVNKVFEQGEGNEFLKAIIEAVVRSK